MFIRMVFLLLVTFSFSLLLLDGCKKKETTNTAKTTVTGQQVKDQISQAAETSGDYLAQQKDAAVKKAEQSFSDFKSDTQQLITKLKNQTSEKAHAVGIVFEGGKINSIVIFNIACNINIVCTTVSGIRLCLF